MPAPPCVLRSVGGEVVFCFIVLSKADLTGQALPVRVELHPDKTKSTVRQRRKAAGLHTFTLRGGRATEGCSSFGEFGCIALRRGMLWISI